MKSSPWSNSPNQKKWNHRHDHWSKRRILIKERDLFLYSWALGTWFNVSTLLILFTSNNIVSSNWLDGIATSGGSLPPPFYFLLSGGVQGVCIVQAIFNNSKIISRFGQPLQLYSHCILLFQPWIWSWSSFVRFPPALPGRDFIAVQFDKSLNCSYRGRPPTGSLPVKNELQKLEDALRGQGRLGT